MPMLPAPPQPLAPLDPHKTRVLTTIYAPRKLKVQATRHNRTAQSRMLDDVPVKPSLSPFHPLPAIGQTPPDKQKTKVIVFNLSKNERPGTMEGKLKLQDVLQPLTPLRIHGYRKDSLEPLDWKPQQLLRENTYDVIEPKYVNAAKVKENDGSLTRRVMPQDIENSERNKQTKISPKTRFKNAAMQVAKLSAMPATGKLLCLRERETFTLHNEEDQSLCKLQKIPQSPTQKLTKLTEIFQSLEMKGRRRDRMKKENSWF